jgi:hypothetical protein
MCWSSIKPSSTSTKIDFEEHTSIHPRERETGRKNRSMNQNGGTLQTKKEKQLIKRSKKTPKCFFFSRLHAAGGEATFFFLISG